MFNRRRGVFAAAALTVALGFGACGDSEEKVETVDQYNKIAPQLAGIQTGFQAAQTEEQYADVSQKMDKFLKDFAAIDEPPEEAKAARDAYQQSLQTFAEDITATSEATAAGDDAALQAAVEKANADTTALVAAEKKFVDAVNAAD